MSCFSQANPVEEVNPCEVTHERLAHGDGGGCADIGGGVYVGEVVGSGGGGDSYGGGDGGDVDGGLYVCVCVYQQSFALIEG